MCMENKHLTTCQKQHRQNEPAGQVDIPTRVEIHVTEYELAGQVVVPTRVEIHVTEYPGHV